MKEIEVQGKRSLAELAKDIQQFGSKLGDDLLLKVLYRWQDPNFLTPEEQSNPVPEWYSFEQGLNQLEKAIVSRTLGSALRAGISSVGELRAIDETKLACLKPHGGNNTIGWDAAKFLKTIFSHLSERNIIGS